jgi:hypothetical protein
MLRIRSAISFDIALPFAPCACCMSLYADSQQPASGHNQNNKTLGVLCQLCPMYQRSTTKACHA